MKHTLSVLGLLLLAQAPALAGEGSGYNGPITAGESIPVHLDRAVKLDTLNRTYKVCTQRLFRSIAQQVAKMTPADFDDAYVEINNDPRSPKWSFSTSGEFGANVYFSAYYEFQPRRSGTGLMPILTNAHHTSSFQGNQAQAGITYINLLIGEPTGSEPTASFEGFALPVATFKNPLNEAEYDELGNVNQSTLILTELTLQIPADYQDARYLTNSKTSKQSSLKADLKGYVNCFYNEIQK